MTKEEWRAAAYAASIRWAKNQPADRTPRNFESIRGAIARSANGLDEPIDGRWWGAVAKWLIRDGWLKPVAVSKPAKSSHHALKPCYWVVR
jgi:hypothetical protein